MVADRQLWVRAKGGLGNRLRRVALGIAGARRSGRRLVVCWPIVKTGWQQFHARLSDLFRGPFDEVDQAAWDYMARSGDWREPISRASLLGGREVMFATEGALGYLPGPGGVKACDFKVLNLVAALELRFHDFYGVFGYPDVGVVVRTIHANRLTCRLSPPAAMEAKIEELVADPSAKLFLSCDNGDVSDRLHRRFRGRLLENGTPREFNSREDLEKAAVDLNILATASHLVLPYASSFGSVAMALQDERGTHEKVGADGT